MFEFEYHQISGLQPSLLENRLKLQTKTLTLLFAKIDLQPNGCWLWTGAKQKGYGAVRIRALGPSPFRAHRICYELVHGPLDRDFDLHHKVEEGCIGPSCVNPDHLLKISHGQHTRDLTPNSMTFESAHQLACQSGHLYTIATLRITADGSRQCRICDAIRHQELRDAARGDRQKFAKNPSLLKTECFRGHSLLDPENVRFIPSKWGDQRVCRACERIRLTAYKAGTRADRIPKDTCKRGHLMTGDNVYHHKDGRRSCKACRGLPRE